MIEGNLLQMNSLTFVKNMESRQFSTARTPQQNGVIERMKRTVQQMAHAMLDESGTPATF